MDLGIALDGEGRLGRPGAVAALARAADRLDYGSVWCIGPWSAPLAAAVAAVTARVRIGIERPIGADALRAIAGGRVVVGELRRWDARSELVAGSTPLRLDACIDRLEIALGGLATAKAAGVAEIVVRLEGDPGVDEALAAYGLLGELAESSSEC